MDDHNIFDDRPSDDSKWLGWFLMALLWAGIGIALHVILARV